MEGDDLPVLYACCPAKLLSKCYLIPQNVPKKWFVYTTVIAAQIIWAIYGLFMEENGRLGINSYIFPFYQRWIVVPMFIILLVAPIRGLEHENLSPPKTWHEFLVFLAMAVLLTLQLIGYIIGNYIVGASVAAAFQPTIPCWALLISVLTGTEPLPDLTSSSGWLAILGIVSALIGCSLITLTGSPTYNPLQPDDYVLGIFMLLLNTFSFAGYVVMQRYFIYASPSASMHHPWAKMPIANTFWTQFFAAILSSFCIIYPAVTQGSTVFLMPPFAGYSLFFGTVFSTVIAMCLITFANSHENPSIVTSFWPTQTIFAVLLAWMVFDSGLSWIQWLGALCIFIGLFGVVTSI